jgi:multidrug resistance efflux pump
VNAGLIDDLIAPRLAPLVARAEAAEAKLVQAEQALEATKIVNCEMLQCPYEVRAKAAEARLATLEATIATLRAEIATLRAALATDGSSMPAAQAIRASIPKDN